MLQLTINAIKTCIGNLIIFSIIPFVWWLLKYRKEENFWRWIGIKTPHLQSKWWWVFAFIIIYIFLYNFDGELVLSQKTIAVLNGNHSSIEGNEWIGMGAAAILPAFLTNFIANGMAEEILFRGFLCKCFSKKFGYLKGVLIQASFFGLMHIVLVLVSGMPVGIDFYVFEFVYTFLGALLLGLANEKLFDGSIWLSISLHGAGNFICQLASIFAWW